MTNGRGWGRAGTVAMMGVAIAVTAVGCPSCPPVKDKGTVTTTGPGTATTPTPGNPLVFTASEGSPVDCVYTYDTGAPGASTFTLDYGAKGITVKANYPTGTTTTGGKTSGYDPPPGSMQITYGDSPYPFDTGQLSLSPAGTGITVTESRPTEWTMVAVGSNPAIALNWGLKWSITLSCGG